MSRPQISRRLFSHALGITAASVALPRLAIAQSDKPLQLIVGYPPGGSTDAFARLLSVPLQGVAGRTVVVRNVPGAGGQIAATALLREGLDGSAVLAINQPDLNLAIARGAGGFKASDFRVIMVDLLEPRVFLVKNDSGIDNFVKFVEQARAKPGKLSISVAGGTAQEVFAKWLVSSLKIDVIIVPFKGGAEAANAVLAGDVTANLGDDFNRTSLRSKTTALFIGADKKSPRWPEAQTLQSQLAKLGLTMPSPNFLSRYGVYVVSAEFMKKDPNGYQALQQAFLKARSGSMMTDYIQKNNLTDMSLGLPGEQFENVFRTEMSEIERIAK